MVSLSSAYEQDQGMSTLLSTDEITAGLDRLPAWEKTGDAESAITRTVKAPAFLDGIEWVRAVAQAAEAVDHHPDIDIRWRSITFRLSTHSAGGLTQADLDLAAVIDGIVSA